MQRHKININKFWWWLIASMGLCILVLILLIRLDSPFTLNYAVPIGILLLLACMYTSKSYHTDKLFQPSKYLFPVFIAMSISFGLVSFMFGLHTEVFTAYDKSGDPQDDKFKWFKMQTILDFPKNQLTNKKRVPEKEIDFPGATDTSNTCHILIVDKTGSVGNSSTEINSYLKSSIIKFFSLITTIDSNITTNDLIVPFILSNIYNNTLNNSDESVCVFLYDGIINDFKNVIPTKYTFQASQLKENNFIETYFKHMSQFNRDNKGKKTNQKTSLKSVLTVLKSKLDSSPDLKRNTDKGNKPFNKYKLTIISDFINSNASETPVDITLIPQIDELYTYTLKGHEKQKNVPTAERLIAGMTKNFKHSKENINVRLDKDEKIKLVYDELKFANFKKYNYVNNDCIEFYCPYRSFNSNQSSQTKIYIPSLKKNGNKESEIFIRIINLDNPGEKKYLTIKKINEEDNTEETIETGELHMTLMDYRDSLLIKFPNAYLFTNNRLIFEIGSVEENKSIVYAVSFLPGLPETTAYYLIVCYCIFAFGVALTLVLPNLFVLIFVGKLTIQISEKSPYIDIASLSVPIILGLSLVVYLFNMYWDYIGWGMFFTLVLLLLFTIPSFYHAVSEFDVSKKTKKFYSCGIYRKPKNTETAGDSSVNKGIATTGEQNGQEHPVTKDQALDDKR